MTLLLISCKINNNSFIDTVNTKYLRNVWEKSKVDVIEN